VRGLLIPLVWLGLMAVGASASVAFSQRRWRRLGDARRVLAESCGVIGIAVTARGVLTGRHGSLSLRLASYVYRRRRGTQVTIQGVAPDVTIAPVDVFGRVAQVLGSTGATTGDPALDARVVVYGSVATTRALLDAATRARLQALFARFAAGRIDRGVLSFESAEALGVPDSLDAVTLHRALDLAHALETPESAAARLAAIVREDPLAQVRALALQALCEPRADHPLAQEALQQASRDPDPSVRLQAARALGPRGETVLQALASDAEAPDVVSAEAIDVLGTALALEDARAVLLRAIASGRGCTARSALRRCIAGGAAEVPVLSAALAAESMVAEEAAHALGRLAGADAVAALHEAEARGGDVRRAAREAIAAIRSRLTGATPGQISLASGDAGQISVVDGAGGRVSIDPDA
jgi:HEAT repeats